jgi:hypothetical protein
VHVEVHVHYEMMMIAAAFVGEITGDIQSVRRPDVKRVPEPAPTSPGKPVTGEVS